jgi:hypothetical protein
MSSNRTRTPHRHGAEPRPATLDDGGDAGGASAAMPAEVELAMSDLVGDANGEIVLFNDSGLRRLAIATDAAVVADGRVGAHRTATGQDVSGFRFLAFDNGLTLYYEPELDLVVRGAR